MGKTFKDDRYNSENKFKSKGIGKKVKKAMKKHRSKLNHFDSTLPPGYTNKVLADRWDYD